jgi:hypothetical protein
MFGDKDILKIYEKAYSDFLKKHKVECSVKIVNELEFMKIARKSKLVRENIKEGVPVLVGALVDHGIKDTVYLSADVLNQITEDEKFVEALILHEFYHVLFKKKVKLDDLAEDLKSEERVKNAMAKEFPKLANYVV